MPPTMARLCVTTNCRLACKKCPSKPEIQRYRGKSMDARWNPTRRNIVEIAGMGIYFIELDGGDILLVSWLPQALELCNELGLYSGITLSGQTLNQRLREWGEEWVGLPGVLRFSVEGGMSFHDAKRAAGCFEALVKGLEVAARVRGGKPTLLVLTLVPGAQGNINEAQIRPVLELARAYGAMIVANFLFGTYYSGWKDECAMMWKGLKDKESELDVLGWLGEQPEVLPFADKLAFLRAGGNDIENTFCRASEVILAVSSGNRIVRHCPYSPYLMAEITEEGGIRGAVEQLNELCRQEGAQPAGKIEDYCRGCGAVCHMCWFHGRGLTGLALERELMRF